MFPDAALPRKRNECGKSRDRAAQQVAIEIAARMIEVRAARRLREASWPTKRPTLAKAKISGGETDTEKTDGQGNRPFPVLCCRPIPERSKCPSENILNHWNHL
jgi:hypothetical protein